MRKPPRPAIVFAPFVDRLEAETLARDLASFGRRPMASEPDDTRRSQDATTLFEAMYCNED